MTWAAEESGTCKKHLQKLKDRVVLRGDNVKKDVVGYRAEFTEQEFVDTVSKLLGVAGETRDANSAYTPVKMTTAPRLLRST